MLVLLVFLVSVASCSSSKNSSSSRYPSGTRTSKSQRTSDSFPGIIFPGSTRTATTKGMPPGQAKKVYGDQSARAYAPGQQKKGPKGGNGKGNGNGHKGGKKKKGKKH